MSSSTSPGLSESLPAPAWLAGAHGRLAFFAYPADRPWLHVLLSHGFSEHSGWWHHVATALQARGVSAYVFDHYHHGRSDGAPGDVPDFGVLVAGLRAALGEGVAPRRAAAPPAPLVVLGHSNGALVTLLALDSPEAEAVQGVVLASPFLGMPRALAVGGGVLARVLRLISPRLPVPLPTRPWRLTGHRALWPQYAEDALRFRTITVRFFLAMRRAVRAARAVRTLGGRPLLLLAAGCEVVVSRAAMDAWYANVQGVQCERRDYPGLHHELFNETAWETVLDDVLAWARDSLAADAPTADTQAPSGTGAQAARPKAAAAGSGAEG